MSVTPTVLTPNPSFYLFYYIIIVIYLIKLYSVLYYLNIGIYFLSIFSFPAVSDFHSIFSSYSQIRNNGCIIIYKVWILLFLICLSAASLIPWMFRPGINCKIFTILSLILYNVHLKNVLALCVNFLIASCLKASSLCVLYEVFCLFLVFCIVFLLISCILQYYSFLISLSCVSCIIYVYPVSNFCFSYFDKITCILYSLHVFMFKKYKDKVRKIIVPSGGKIPYFILIFSTGCPNKNHGN